MPLNLSDLIFPTQSCDFSKTVSRLRQANLSVANRIQSILQDAAFVASVATAYRLPLIANERCGSWYVSPELKKGSAYFKSTDGHVGQWDLSARRLNLHLLGLIAEHRGCVFCAAPRSAVDHDCTDRLARELGVSSSTRLAEGRVRAPGGLRGRRFRVVLTLTGRKGYRMLYQRPSRSGARSSTEPCSATHPPPISSTFLRRQCRSRSALRSKPCSTRSFASSGHVLATPGTGTGQPWTDSTQSLSPPHETLSRAGDRPLRPIWVTPASTLPREPLALDDFHPVVLCTASRRVDGDELSENGYIQGAGDDSESWARGLTPCLLWAHLDKLQDGSMGAAEMERFVHAICEHQSPADLGPGGGSRAARPRPVGPGSSIYVGPASVLLQNETASPSAYDRLVVCHEHLDPGLRARWRRNVLHLPCRAGKLGSRDLRTVLYQLPDFVDAVGPGVFLVCCDSGRDLSIGVALTMVCMYLDGDGKTPALFLTSLLLYPVVLYYRV